MDKRLQAFERLLTIMDELREKCPWDKKQTFDSLLHLTIEETYELVDAVQERDWSAVEGELGDLFLHLTFYAKLGQEKKEFDVTSVLNKICEKLIHRHPHIYGDVVVADEEEVKQNWEKLKLKEGKKSILEGVPKALPALVKAHRIQEKVKGVGFEWDDSEGAFDKILEEIQEFKVEVDAGSDKKEGEFGDLLFSLINYGRYVDINPENALELTNKKFIKRFTGMEEIIANEGKSMTTMTLEEMDVYWDRVKKLHKSAD
jgi:XTP/dITP diphosphohydrolase